MKHSPNRICGLAAVFASGVCAGIMESSSGSDIVTPKPRKNVRRGRCRLVRNVMGVASFSLRYYRSLGSWEDRGGGLHAALANSLRQNEPKKSLRTSETLIRTILVANVRVGGRLGREVVRLKEVVDLIEEGFAVRRGRSRLVGGRLENDWNYG